MDLDEIENSLPKEQPLVNPEILESLGESAAYLLTNGYQTIQELLAECRKQQADNKSVREHLAELNLALAEYGNEKGIGQMFHQDLQLCLNVVRQRKR